MIKADVLTTPNSTEESCNVGVEATVTNNACATILIHTQDVEEGPTADGIITKFIHMAKVTGNLQESLNVADTVGGAGV